MSRTLISTLIIVLSVSGCATLSESECEIADWQTIGFEDGSSGRLASYVGNHRKACADYGIKPDLAQYQLGHARGVTGFCTARTGFNQGNAGRGYNGVCPGELEADFLLAYEQGRDLYLLRRDIQGLQRETQDTEAELDEVLKGISELEVLLVTQKAGPTQRLEWIMQLKHLVEDRDRLEHALQELDLATADKEDEYRVLAARYNY